MYAPFPAPFAPVVPTYQALVESFTDVHPLATKVLPFSNPPSPVELKSISAGNDVNSGVFNVPKD